MSAQILQVAAGGSAVGSSGGGQDLSEEEKLRESDSLLLPLDGPALQQGCIHNAQLHC